MVVILPAKRVTHLIAGRDRAAEIAFGVVCIEGHQVTSIDTLTEFGVVVEKFDSTDTIEVSPSQLQRAEALLLPGRRPVSNKTFQMWSRRNVRRKVNGRLRTTGVILSAVRCSVS